MARFEDLLPEARVALREAPDISIESALRRSAQRFCELSSIWREELDPFAWREGVALYDLEPPTGGRVERVLSIRVAGAETRMQQSRFEDIHRMSTASGRPETFALTADGLGIHFWRAPNSDHAGKAVALYVALVPTRTARELPEFLVDEWHDAVVAGAHAEMFANVGMPWFSPPMAADARGRFDAGVAKARRKQLSGNHAELRVKPRPWI